MKEKSLLSLVQMCMLCAIAFIFIFLIRFPIFPAAPYLVYDAGDIPLLIGAFMFGPLPALAMTIVVAAMQAVFLSADGFVGFFMHVAASGVMVLAVGIIYKKFHTRKGAAISLIVATLLRAAVMVPMNLIFTVNVYGVPLATVVASMPFIIGFNLIQGGINSAVVFLIYKPLSRIFNRDSTAVKNIR